MKKLSLILTLLTLAGAASWVARAADEPAVPSAAAASATAATPASATPKRAEPTTEQRLADLEAYVNNGARVADGTNNVSSKLGTYDEKTGSYSANPGPGHNGWMMTSSALVLFMTLPGLALFYGGLVRRKNVLSVLAQCLGIAGLVAILWWMFGYSMVFSSQASDAAQRGSTFWGSLKTFAFLNGVDSSPNTDYSGWVSH